MDKSGLDKSEVKKVVLIGDSIRIGYQSFVTEDLKNLASVYGPEQNGGTSENILKNIDRWIPSENLDVIHLNCGLHDIKVEKDTDINQIPLEDYIRNLKEIFKNLKKKSKVVIWATSTIIDENSHNKIKPFYRFFDDLEKYNQASILVAKEFNIPVNNLYEFSENIKNLLTDDGVHFTEEGYKLLGEKVSSFIKKFLYNDF